MNTIINIQKCHEHNCKYIHTTVKWISISQKISIQQKINIQQKTNISLITPRNLYMVCLWVVDFWTLKSIWRTQNYNIYIKRVHTQNYNIYIKMVRTQNYNIIKTLSDIIKKYIYIIVKHSKIKVRNIVKCWGGGENNNKSR